MFLLLGSITQPAPHLTEVESQLNNAFVQIYCSLWHKSRCYMNPRSRSFSDLNSRSIGLHVHQHFKGLLILARPILIKFHMQPPGNMGTKVWSNGSGHMTKMAVMPKYGKNLKKSSQKPQGWLLWNLVCSIRRLSTTKSVQIMILGWPWPILWQGQFGHLDIWMGKW